jgi:hypothetical protein
VPNRSSFRLDPRTRPDSPRHGGGWPGSGATRFGTPNPCRPVPEHGLKTTRGTLSPNSFHRYGSVIADSFHQFVKAPAMKLTWERLTVRTTGGRVALRVLGYGAILSVLVMFWLGWEPRGLPLCLLAGIPVIAGPWALIFLVCSPGVSRREGWVACAVVLAFLVVLMFPVLRMD